MRFLLSAEATISQATRNAGGSAVTDDWPWLGGRLGLELVTGFESLCPVARSCGELLIMSASLDNRKSSLSKAPEIL